MFADALGPFDIQVMRNGTHSVTLNWTVPSEIDDGTPLTDLAGYKILYGAESGNHPQLIDITGSSTVNHTIEGLASGTYYFVTAAYNDLGVASDFSNEVSVTLNWCAL